MICSHCNSTYNVDVIGNSTMCMQCGYTIAENIGKFIVDTEQEIIESYNINPINENPLLVCYCDSKEVIPFNFYTPSLNDHEYFLVLCTICRICGGYKEVKISNARLPVPIRNIPPVCGLTVTPKIEKKGTLNEMFI